MKRVFPLFFVLLCPLLAEDAKRGVTIDAPITNFRLTELSNEGFRSSLVRGSEAHYINDNQIDLVGMQYTTFLENEAGDLDATLLAPTATVFILNGKVNKVRGNESVRLIRKNIEVTGELWTYEHAEKNSPTPKKLVIEKNVHAIFRIEMKDILK